jgi:hypothetical protein
MHFFFSAKKDLKKLRCTFQPGIHTTVEEVEAQQITPRNGPPAQGTI